MGLEDLGQIMAELQTYRDEKLLVGYEGADDCGVYALNDEIALVESVDFITPIVDDPFIYGQIAASNALSDLFAMGATAKTALNLLMWDKEHISQEMLKEILRGGAEKLKEARVTLLGGHSIIDSEQKYGLSVSGIIHPQKIWRNCGAKVGDVLILTKPLGSGIVATAFKMDKLAFDAKSEAVRGMCQLNARASEVAKDYEIHACTDVTGFGLIGHLLEMCAEEKSVEIRGDKIPLYEFVEDAIRQELVPNGSRENFEFLSSKVQNHLSFEKSIAFFDSQTSGGLLLALPKNQSQSLLEKLKKAGYERSAIIGEFVPKKECPIIIA